MAHGNELRHQCEREKAALAQQIVDLEYGLAALSRRLAEERRTREAHEAQHDLDMANIRHWLREQFEREKETHGLRGVVRRLGGFGL